MNSIAVGRIIVWEKKTAWELTVSLEGVFFKDYSGCGICKTRCRASREGLYERLTPLEQVVTVKEISSVCVNVKGCVGSNVVPTADMTC